MTEISNTRMNDLLCSFRFQALYERGVAEEDDDDSLMGVINHAGAAKYGTRLWKIKRYRDLPLYMDILTREIARHKQLVYSPNMVDQIVDVGQKFAERWSLDKDADDHLFEVRLAVDRNYQKCEVTDSCDKIAGTPDHVTLLRHGTRARVEDFKMGFKLLEYDEAQRNKQLLLYAWLLWKNYPELEEIVIILNAPMFYQQSMASFKVELLPELVEPRIEAAWQTIDRCQRAYGTNTWPAEAHWEACKWCRLECPKYHNYLEALNGIVA